MTIGPRLPHFRAKEVHQMLSRQRVLIVEGVPLIALDIQRILEDANAAQAVFAGNFLEAHTLAATFPQFDLAIVNPPADGSPEMEIAALLAAAGPALVVCTATAGDLSGTPLAGAELIVKPFSDEELLAACARAQARRKA
jgi:CheY-like chemotaxis protein